MGVTPEDVRRVAALARLRLESAEAEALTRQLNDILRHVDALQAVDIAAAPADAAGAAPRAPLRADQAGADPLADEPAAFAPSWQEGFFTVPRLASHEEADLPAEGRPGLGP